MSPRDLLRALTPLGWLALIAAIVVLLFIAGRGVGFRWDPLNLADRRLEAADQRAATATLDAAARRLEVEGAAGQARRLDDRHQQALRLARITAGATAQARNAHDADHPLDAGRTDRLRAHDRELCALAPDLCRPAPAADPDNREHAVSSGAPAGKADGG